MISDIKDQWNNNKLLEEGDICILHNWGSEEFYNQPITLAELYYDTQYHQWDFNKIAGSSIEDRYDLFRTSPRKIGTKKEGITEKEFKQLGLNEQEWEKYLKNQAEITTAKWEIKHKTRQLNKKKREIEEKQQEIQKQQKEIEEKTKELQKQIKELKESEKSLNKTEGEKND